MRKSRLAGALASAALLTGATLAGASPASADQVWIQSVQRSAATATCPTDAGSGAEAGWIISVWSPSWELWPNGGTGGWVCTRTVTWGLDDPAPRLHDVTPTPDPDVEDPEDPTPITCTRYVDGTTWLSFAGGDRIALPADIAYYEPTCTQGPAATLQGTGYVVYASSAEAALAMCGSASAWQVLDPPAADPNIWFCSPRAT